MNTKQVTVRFLKNHNGSPILRRMGYNKHIPVRVTEFIEATDLVPKGWAPWFWIVVSENAPFSWGDNNFVLFMAESTLSSDSFIALSGSPTIEKERNPCVTSTSTSTNCASSPFIAPEKTLLGMRIFYHKTKIRGNLGFLFCGKNI